MSDARNNVRSHKVWGYSGATEGSPGRNSSEIVKDRCIGSLLKDRHWPMKHSSEEALRLIIPPFNLLIMDAFEVSISLFPLNSSELC